MEKPPLYKCTCPNCGAAVECQMGQEMECPECREKIPAPDPARAKMAEDPNAPKFKTCPDCGAKLPLSSESCAICEINRKQKRVWTVISIVVILLLAGGGGFVLWRAKNKPAPPEEPKHGSYMLIQQPEPQMPKSTNDLRPGRFFLEKRRGSDLVMAVGDIENASANFHGEIHADLDLLDRTGKKIGTVSDFITSLGPHKVWHFLAPVTDTNAISARLSRITETQ